MHNNKKHAFQGLLLLTMLLFTLAGYAYSVLAPLTSWIVGITTANQASNASFKVGVTADAGLGFNT